MAGTEGTDEHWVGNEETDEHWAGTEDTVGDGRYEADTVMTEEQHAGTGMAEKHDDEMMMNKEDKTGKERAEVHECSTAWDCGDQHEEEEVWKLPDAFGEVLQQ